MLPIEESHISKNESYFENTIDLSKYSKFKQSKRQHKDFNTESLLYLSEQE